MLHEYKYELIYIYIYTQYIYIYIFVLFVPVFWSAMHDWLAFALNKFVF